jgi:ubiquinone biosynthesis protein
VIAAFSHLARLGRAGFVFAREGVLALVDPAPLIKAWRRTFS